MWITLRGKQRFLGFWTQRVILLSKVMDDDILKLSVVFGLLGDRNSKILKLL